MTNKKRKTDSDEEDVEVESDSQAKKTSKSKASSSKSKAPAKPKTAKKPKFDHSEEEASPEEEVKQPGVKTVEGESYVDLGKKKRASVRSFKDSVFLDIREYYGTDGDEKPGKKGISLSYEQWRVFKRSINAIDSQFAEHGKK